MLKKNLLRSILFSSLLVAIVTNGNANEIELPSARPKPFVIKALPKKQINDQITRQTIHGEKGSIGLLTLKKGAVVPKHHHINEQFSFIFKGKGKFIFDNQYEVVLVEGEGIIIPANVPHAFEALEDNTLNMDFFSPRREDWINGTDNYYQK
jgi:quercetin dioxygenase-like cupin family protein